MQHFTQTERAFPYCFYDDGSLWSLEREGGLLDDSIISGYMDLLNMRNQAEFSSTPRTGMVNTLFLDSFAFGETAMTGREDVIDRTFAKYKLHGMTWLLDFDEIHFAAHCPLLQHWYLIVVKSPPKASTSVRVGRSQRQHELIVFDSLEITVPVARDRAQRLKRYFEDLASRKGRSVSWKAVRVGHTPKQENACDCGVFMLKFMEYRSRGQSFDFSQASISGVSTNTADGTSIRRRMERHIIAQELSKSELRSEVPSAIFGSGCGSSVVEVDAPKSTDGASLTVRTGGRVRKQRTLTDMVCEPVRKCQRNPKATRPRDRGLFLHDFFRCLISPEASSEIPIPRKLICSNTSAVLGTLCKSLASVIYVYSTVLNVSTDKAFYESYMKRLEKSERMTFMKRFPARTILQKTQSHLHYLRNRSYPDDLTREKAAISLVKAVTSII
eukprot:Rmarinus@m.7379